MATLYAINSTASAWTTAANWSTGSAPVSGDTAVLNHLGVGGFTSGLATGIGSGAGAESLNLIMEQSFTGPLGAVSSGAATYLAFAATLETLSVYIGQKTGQGSGSGSGRIFLDATNVTTATLYLYDSASSGTEVYYPPILLKGTWTIYQYGGNYGLAARPGETGTLTAGSIIAEGEPGVTPQAYFGTGATVTRLDAATGTILNRSGNTTATLNLTGDADYTYEGAGAHTTASLYGNANVLDKGTGAWTTLNLGGAATFKRRATASVTVGGTASNFYGGTYDIKNGKTGTTTTSNKTLVGVGVGNGLTVVTNAGENW